VRFENLAVRADRAGAAYFPHTQSPAAGRLRWIAVKTAVEPGQVVRTVRGALAAIDPDLPLSDIQSMSQRMTGSISPQRLAMALAGAFGAVALCLSTIGLYGVLSYVVARRRREIGIRIALGSTAGAVFTLVFREGAALVAAGLALGLLGAIAMSRTLDAHVFGVTPTDPLVLGTVAAGTAGVALLACVSPARRAARVDPLRVL
jgi:ABC-type antimicrobial peptide transport system permease subunit